MSSVLGLLSSLVSAIPTPSNHASISFNCGQARPCHLRAAEDRRRDEMSLLAHCENGVAKIVSTAVRLRQRLPRRQSFARVDNQRFRAYEMVLEVHTIRRSAGTVSDRESSDDAVTR